MTMSNSVSEKIAPRVSILDAQEFDIEIHAIIRNHVNAVISYLSPGTLSSYEPELEALIKLFIWKISVDNHGSSFGQQLLHLQYSKDCNKKLRIYGFLSIFGSYLKERIEYLSSSSNEGKSAIQILDKCIHIMDIITFAAFLRQGVASTFLERFLGISTVSVAPKTRSVGYSYMTRELIWHGFMEMLIFVLPLINYHALKRRLRRIFPLPKNSEKILQDNDVLRKCSICQETPVLPYSMGCPHVFCYYCLSSQKLADQGFECPDCGRCCSEIEKYVVSR